MTTHYAAELLQHVYRDAAPAIVKANRHEAAALGLLAALTEWADANDVTAATDYLAADEIVSAGCRVIEMALNMETGRLDCGKLHAAVLELDRRRGIEALA